MQRRNPLSDAPASPRADLRVTVSLGDEVLRGTIADTNSAITAAKLYPLGLSLRRTTVVGDRGEDIRRALLEDLGARRLLHRQRRPRPHLRRPDRRPARSPGGRRRIAPRRTVARRSANALGGAAQGADADQQRAPGLHPRGLRAARQPRRQRPRLRAADRSLPLLLPARRPARVPPDHRRAGPAAPRPRHRTCGAPLAHASMHRHRRERAR